MLSNERETASTSESNGGGPDDLSDSPPRFDCVSLVLRVMEHKRLGLRGLADRTHIGRSRLGVLLHRDPAKRSMMSLREYHLILAALEIDPIEAVIRAGSLEPAELYASARYQTLIAMLCEMFRGLAASMIDALEQVDGIDGTEVRLEWAGALRNAVVKRVVHEVSAVASRRAALSDFSIFG